ncbi:basic salivary proline-rich protein 1-like [Leptopilina boulardi]|uniref:basic salivary proline-rich protein 1-like n=1 Tax=Leptopilina boulardi TaxID=63433 RepID=UPI0021F640CB|nr:basic salivary proline-rich protein 1-like [Leptopilina boulardi]
MDQPFTPRNAEPPANQPPPMVKQNPPGFQQAPPGGQQRFPVINNNGPGQPPPLRHLDSRSSLIPGQFPQQRPPPPYGPRPRNVFYPRGQAPPLPGSQGQFPSPQGSVPGSPNQTIPPQGFPGPRFIQNPNIRGPPQSSQRSPFPQQFFPRNGNDQIRGPIEFPPNQKLQRNDSVANLNPRYPIPADRRPQLIPQISIERMSDEGSTKSIPAEQADIETIKKKENDDDDDDVVVDSEKLSDKIEIPKSPRSSAPSRQDSTSSDGKNSDLDKNSLGPSNQTSPVRLQSPANFQSSPAYQQSPIHLQSSPAQSPSHLQSSPAHQQSPGPASRPPSASLSLNKTSRPPSAIKDNSDKNIENKNNDEIIKSIPNGQ